MALQKRVAVILCGSGFKDGSEIRESVGVLWAISAENALVEMFSLDEAQHEVVNCLTGQVTTESRNQLVESARIARGNVKNLSELKPEDFDCLIIPGGHGAAKNLCDLAFKGKDATVHSLVKNTIETFHANHKPIGAVCIAPAIVALALKDKKLEFTLGMDCDTSKMLESFGHHHMEKKASECHVDRWNRFVSTPAYMLDNAELSDIFKGIRSMVKECLALI